MSLQDPSTYFEFNADSAFTGTNLDNIVDYLGCRTIPHCFTCLL